MKKLYAILVSFAMILAMAIPALAANPVETSTEAGVPVATKLTKAYDAATGVTAPTNQTFTFTVKNIVPTGEEAMDDATVTVNGATSLSVADIFATTVFPGAGKYTFEVTEDAPEEKPDGAYDAVDGRVATFYDETDDNFKVTETVTYSQAKYQVDLIVASYTDPVTLESSLYVQSAAVTRLLDDEGTVDGEKPEETGTEGDGIELTFNNDVNKEIKNISEEPTTKEEDKRALEISKTVDPVDGSDPANPAQEFNFKATVSFPANSEINAYTAIVKEMDGEDVVETEKSVTFTKTAPTQTFTLKDGQWLAFTDIEAGAQVTYLVEDSIPGFTPDVAIDTAAEYYSVKDTGNNAIDVTNAYDSDEGSLTGILMSNIPYIVLALVAIGGLCAYVVMRRKNGEEA